MTRAGGVYIPLLVRRGGRDIKKYREASSDGADGVVDLPKCFGMRAASSLTTPSARNKDASRHFHDRASTPPHEEGNTNKK